MSCEDVENDMRAMTAMALIPAKGRSERLPRKNLCCLGGRPLVQWAVEAAHACGLFTPEQIVVSSEDEEVLQVAARASAVPLRRPADLASPSATVVDVLSHARGILGPRANVLVLLPSSPFRSAETLNRVWILGVTQDKNVLTITPTHPPEGIFVQGFGGDLMTRGLSALPRNVLPPYWRHDGVAALHLPFGATPLGLPVSFPESMDINTPEDLAYAQYLLDTGKVPWIAKPPSAS